MPITVPGVPSTVRRPGFFFGVTVGGAGVNTGAAVPNLLLVGNMIAADLTGSAPSFTVTAGTRQVSGIATETPIQVASPDEVAAYCGVGSELHRMAIVASLLDPGGDSFTMWICPIAEGGSNTKASATLTLVGNATSSGTIRIVIANQTIDVGVTSGDTITTITTNIATAIVKNFPQLPATAQFSAGVLTITAKHGGTRGNDIPFRAYWLNGTNQIPIATSTTQFGTAATITGSGYLGSGATGDSATNAVANIAARRYHRMAWPFPSTDTTNINLVRDGMASQSVATIMHFEQAVFGSRSTPSTVQTNAGSVNHERCQIVAAQNNDMPPPEMAAAVAAARLAGDFRMTSVSIPGETQSKGANLNGLQLPIPAPASQSDEPTDAQITTMINSGVSPLRPSQMRPGYMELVSSITTRFKDASGNFDYSVLKTKIVTVLDSFASRVSADFATRYRGYRLRPDNPDGSVVSIPLVVTPTILRDRVATMLVSDESVGDLIDVALLLPELKVQIDPANKNRVNFDIPLEPIPDLDIAAGVARQRSA